MTIEGVKRSIAPDQLDKVQWDITNKSTSYVGRIACALFVIALLATVVTFTMHGGIATIGSDVMIFGGGAAGLAGILYMGLKFRDYREKKRLEEGWKENPSLQVTKKTIQTTQLRPGQELVQRFTFDKEDYYLRAGAWENQVRIYKHE